MVESELLNQEEEEITADSVLSKSSLTEKQEKIKETEKIETPRTRDDRSSGRVQKLQITSYRTPKGGRRFTKGESSKWWLYHRDSIGVRRKLRAEVEDLKRKLERSEMEKKFFEDRVEAVEMEMHAMTRERTALLCEHDEKDFAMNQLLKKSEELEKDLAFAKHENEYLRKSSVTNKAWVDDLLEEINEIKKSSPQ